MPDDDVKPRKAKRQALEQFISNKESDENKQMKDMFDKILDDEPDQDFLKSLPSGEDSKPNSSDDDDEPSNKDNAIEYNEEEGAIPSESKKNERKIYERKARESLYSEELEFHTFRKKKL